jgi:putative nucleotidyltransferase with HDIG domain
MAWFDWVVIASIVLIAITAIIFIARRSAQPDSERQLLEAYLGVTMKRRFSTGPEAFNHYLKGFEHVMQKGDGEATSLLETVTALAFAIDAKDHYTRDHSKAVSRLAAQIARQLGLSDTQIEEVRLGGILHDIGKIGVPEAILNKSSRLTTDEYNLMKSHTLLGEKILEPLKSKVIEGIRGMVRNHHEMVDGKGYPDGLRGGDIPLGARIVAVAESFDNMVSDLPYRRGRSLEEAVEELRRCCGTQFDPDIVEAFLESLRVLGDPRTRPALDDEEVRISRAPGTGRDECS